MADLANDIRLHSYLHLRTFCHLVRIACRFEAAAQEVACWMFFSRHQEFMMADFLSVVRNKAFRFLPPSGIQQCIRILATANLVFQRLLGGVRISHIITCIAIWIRAYRRMVVST